MSETNIVITEEVYKASFPASFGGEIATVLAANMGRENKVHTVASVSDFNRIFGTSDTQEYKTLRYLLNRGNVLKIVRTPVKAATGETLAKASATFYKNGGESGDGMVVTAVANGTAYNGDDTGKGIGITIKYQGAGLFSLIVTRGITDAEDNPSPEVIEQFPVVSLWSDSPYYYPFVVKSEVVDISLTVNADFGENDSLFASTPVDIEKALSGGDGSVIDTTTSALSTAAAPLGSRDVQFATFILPGKTATDVNTVAESIYALKSDFVTLVYADGISNPITAGEVSQYHCAYPRVWVNKLGWIDPVVPIADRIAINHKKNIFFKALANADGGLLDDVIDVEVTLSDSDIKTAQNAHVNPIIVRPNVGCVLWGQDTCATSRTQIGRMSVRLLVNYLKRTVYDISLDYMFKDNNSFTWGQWIDEVTPIVRAIAESGGISEYRVVCDETSMTAEDIANGIMRGYIVFTPYNQITKIYVNFTVDETGVSFE